MVNQQPCVTIQDGQLQGTEKVDWLGGKYYSFQGIPYAKPPLGELRFKAPQPPNSWQGIRDASKEGSECYNRNPLTQQIVGSEDCLYLNVYSPQVAFESKQHAPVMIWIHGGGFTCGSSNTELYGPDCLVAEGVVVVSLNYRLGILGFSCFSDQSFGIPGNAGLKDQVLALKWVQNNISAFGGDPNNVTIFGESAGGASVHFLMLSPLCKGLFQKAISQSGVSSSVWARGQLTAPLVSKTLQLEDATEAEVIKKLYELPVEKLFELQEKLRDVILSDNRPFGPVVELSNDKSAFISRDPQEILTSGEYNHVPLIIGYTSREGILIDYLKDMLQGESKWSIDFEDTIPFYLGHPKVGDIWKTVGEKSKQFYYGDETPSNENMNSAYLLAGDAYFFISINNAVQEHTRNSSCPVYYYRMSLETGLNMAKQWITSKASGAAHGDDLGYLFNGIWTPEIRRNSPEDIGRRRFIKLWTTFAKYGDPNPPKQDQLINVSWLPTKNNELHFLDIGENLTVGVNPETERVAFWDEIYCSVKKAK